MRHPRIVRLLVDPNILELGSPGWEPEMLTATQMAQIDKKY